MKFIPRWKLRLLCFCFDSMVEQKSLHWAWGSCENHGNSWNLTKWPMYKIGWNIYIYICVCICHVFVILHSTSNLYLGYVYQYMNMNPLKKDGIRLSHLWTFTFEKKIIELLDEPSPWRSSPLDFIKKLILGVHVLENRFQPLKTCYDSLTH